MLSEIFGMPDSLPQDLLDKAECVIVFPSVKKLALGVGGSYGRGVIACRSGATFSGPWNSAAMFALEGASIGFQVGAQATDFVMLVMNDRGASPSSAARSSSVPTPQPPPVRKGATPAPRRISSCGPRS